MKQSLSAVLLLLIIPLPIAAQTLTGSDKVKEEKKVVVGKECGNPDTLHRVQNNMKNIKGRAAAWGVAVEDKGEGYCGYNMISGKKVKKLDGDKSEAALIAEIGGFFGKRK